MGASESNGYTRQVFEHLLGSMSRQTSGVDSHSFFLNLLYVRDDGAWLKDGSFGPDASGLGWSPACDMDWPGSPDPLSTPALRFPFTANQLAAWLLDGPGFFVAEAAGDLATGPDKEALDALGDRGVKAREALSAAYEAIRAAQAVVGEVDPAVIDAGRIAALRHEQRMTEAQTRRDNNWAELGIDRQESEARRLRFLAAVKPGRTIHRAARQADDEAHADWRRKMVRALVGPPNMEGTAGTRNEHEGVVSGDDTSRWTDDCQPAVQRGAHEAIGVTGTDFTTLEAVDGARGPSWRDSHLKAILERAGREAADATDAASVWAALMKMAEGSNRPAPLIGVADNGEGIKYTSPLGEVEFLSRDAFRMRWKRAKRNARAR